MLKLVLNGTPLNIPPDIQLNLIYENPMLFNDRIPSSHSLSFSLPTTAHNNKIFGNPGRLNSPGAFREYPGMDIFFDAQKLLTGVLVVEKFDRDIKCFFRGSVITDLMRLPLYEVPLTKYSFGKAPGTLLQPGSWSNSYRAFMHSSTDMSNGVFVCPPVRIKDESWPYLTDESEIPELYGNYAAFRQYFNFWNAVSGGYTMMGGASAQHTACYPFPFLHAVIDSFFAGQVDHNPFAEGDLARIVLVSSYHPRFSDSLLTIRNGIIMDEYSTENGEDNFFRINSFLGTLPANELIRESFKLISATLYPTGTGFKIKPNTEIINNPDVVDWTAKRINHLIISKQAGQFYDYGYTEGEIADPEETQATEVLTIKNMVDFPVGEGGADIYVTSTRELYHKSLRSKADPSDPDRFDYELKASAIGRKKNDTGKQGYNMASNLQPVRMSVHQYWVENSADPGEKIKFGDWYVPEWSGNRFARPDRHQIGLYLGVRDTFSTLPGSVTSPNIYPLLAPHNVDGYGNKIGDLSLEWDGEHGFLDKYHQPFKNWIEKEKIAVSGNFILTSRDLKNLDLSRKVHFKGKNFFIEKVSVTVRQNRIEPAQVDLVEADLPE